MSNQKREMIGNVELITGKEAREFFEEIWKKPDPDMQFLAETCEDIAAQETANNARENYKKNGLSYSDCVLCEDAAVSAAVTVACVAPVCAKHFRNYMCEAGHLDRPVYRAILAAYGRRRAESEEER